MACLLSGNLSMDLPRDFAKAIGLPRKAGPVTALHVFDFDGTLVRTPSPEQGKAAYLAATGQVWKGGWWGRIGSLSPPVMQSPCPQNRIVKTVFDELREVVLRSETAVGVVVTGRIKPLRPAVLRILDEICVEDGKNYLHHDAVFTHPGGRPSTMEFKQALFKMMLTREPLSRLDIKHLHIWEDRKEHAECFATEFCDQIRDQTGIQTTVHYVSPDMP